MSPPSERHAPVDDALVALLERLHQTRPPDALLHEVVAALTNVVDAMGALDWQEHVAESLDAAVQERFQRGDAP